MAENFNPNQYDRRDEREQLTSWIPTLIMLFFFFPIGLVMLIIKLFGGSESGRRRSSVSQHPYDMNQGGQAWAEQPQQTEQTEQPKQTEQTRQAQQEQQERVRQARQTGGRDPRQAPHAQRAQAQQTQSQPRYTQQAAPKKKAKKGPHAKAMKAASEAGDGFILGGGLAAGIAGFIAFVSFFEIVGWGGFSALFSGIGMEEFFAPLGICGAGLVLLYYGFQKKKRGKRWRKYLALIGKRDSISVVTLAQAMGVSVHRACDDLQGMLDAGIFPMGYLDLGSGRLILTDEGIRDVEPEAEKAAPQSEEEAPRGLEQEDAVLAQIRQVNDEIEDPEMTRKINRIGEITRKIFTYVRQKPDREGQLRSFLSYYLPTTLKILRAYAQMEAQGIEGENISAAKVRIEGMMDKVVDGFETQLDRLFQDDAMDITTDVAVLERMLDKDGLGGSQGMTLGG